MEILVSSPVVIESGFDDVVRGSVRGIVSLGEVS